MLRIAHRIAALKDTSPPSLIFRRIAEKAHIVICDNIAEMFLGVADELRREDIPCCISPWQSAIYEWAHPGKEAKQMACAVLTMDGDDPATKVGPVDLRRVWLDTRKIKCTPRFDPDGSIRWLMSFKFAAVVNGQFNLLPLEMIMLCDRDGNAVHGDTFHNQDAKYDDFMSRVSATCLRIVGTANALANCKNVKCTDCTDEVAPPAKWQRRFGTPEIRYSRIAIDGFTAEAKRQGGGIEGIQKAWHICRGSFATYTADKPLFGKQVGRFWRPQHVKGKKELGEVHSTHEVQAPSPEILLTNGSPQA